MKTNAVILAGGEGSRLGTLTAKRTEPAVPFAGKYRIIDFTLSNCVNSGIFDVMILAQYRPHSLIDHIGAGGPGFGHDALLVSIWLDYALFISLRESYNKSRGIFLLMLNRSLFDYRLGLVVILGTLIIATLGCSFAWNMLTRGTLQGDLDELFHQRVSFDETTCQMIASSRSGFCLLEASSSAIETLVDKLNLEEVTMNSSVEVKSRYHVWEAEGGCRKNAAFFDLTGIQVFISERRAIELRLGSGGSFEYLMLYYNPANDALCVQVSYAYS